MALVVAQAERIRRGSDYAIEVTLADALVTIMDGGRPVLPEDNPYADVVRQLLIAIYGHGDASF